MLPHAQSKPSCRYWLYRSPEWSKLIPRKQLHSRRMSVRICAAAELGASMGHGPPIYEVRTLY